MFNIKTIKNTTIIEVKFKRLDNSACLAFEKIFKTCSKKHRHIVVKLNRVQYISNCFLEKLIRLRKDHLRSVDISICGMSAEILSIFYIIKLEKLFDFYMDEYDALEDKNNYIRRRLKIV